MADSAGLPTPTLQRSRRAEIPAETALVLIWTGAAACVGLWVQNGPAFTGLGESLVSLGRVAGLLVGYSVVILMVLMARIPALERGVGATRLSGWHATWGRLTILLLVAHGLLIVSGYAVRSSVDLVTQSRALLAEYPYLPHATIAGIILVAVGIVSLQAARRRLPYETWYFIHLSTYLAIILAYAHQVTNGTDLAPDPAVRWGWTGMYILAGLLVLWYRGVLPIIQALRYQLQVESVEEEAPGIVSVHLKGKGLDRLAAASGHFFRWRFLTPRLWWMSHPYSLSAAPTDTTLRLTAKGLGGYSRALAPLEPGTRVLAAGPYGLFTERKRQHQKVLLVAGGIGITPLRTLFETLAVRPGELTLLYRARDPSEIVFKEELEQIAEQQGATLHLITGTREELGRDPLTAAALQELVPDLPEHDVFVCGPPSMVTAVHAALEEAGVPKGQVHDETFSF